jgi:methionyl-tRNA synthetase
MTVPAAKRSKYYVTTPIYYINDVAHIGHAYSTIAADVVVRYYRSVLGPDHVLFVTGTDENSQKTTDAAEKAGLDVDTYTERTAKQWQDNWDKLGISYDRFIRTTEADHASTVQDILQKVYDNGDIYKGVYEGLYCVGHEAFMKEEDLVDGLCPDHKKPPEKIREENWFFRLSKYEQQVLEYIEANPEFIQPTSRRNEVLSFIRQKGLEDFSISRESRTWGIRLPFDDTQVAYVWFDALINYVTAAGYGTDKFEQWWPADLHIVGKDIIKFHCIYWPAMLMSAGLALPHKVFAHGFFTIDGTKVSKSLGNAIDPLELAGVYGNDALRYFLLREIPFGADGDFSLERFAVVYETELGNKLGNLVARTAAMLTKYCDSSYDETDVAADLNLYDYITRLEFDKYLAEIIGRCEQLNTTIEETKPWQLAKEDPSKVREVLSAIASELVQLAEYLEPFLPDTAIKIRRIFANGKVDNSEGVLFPRIEK